LLTEGTKPGIKFVKRQDATRCLSEGELNVIDKFSDSSAVLRANLPGCSNEPISELVKRHLMSQVACQVLSN
jgi:hypothetical protein